MYNKSRDKIYSVTQKKDNTLAAPYAGGNVYMVFVFMWRSAMRHIVPVLIGEDIVDPILKDSTILPSARGFSRLTGASD